MCTLDFPTIKSQAVGYSRQLSTMCKMFRVIYTVITLETNCTFAHGKKNRFLLTEKTGLQQIGKSAQ